MHIISLYPHSGIHLAIIIDNEGNTSEDTSSPDTKKKKNDTQKLLEKEEEKKENREHSLGSENIIKFNGQAHQFRLIFESLNFHVLSFNTLGLQSIVHLTQVITTYVDPNDLSALVLIVLCKDKTCEEFEMVKVLECFSRFYARICKIFFTHYTKPKRSPVPPEIIPENSVVLTVTSNGSYEPNYLPLVRTFAKIQGDFFKCPLKECFDELNDELMEQDGRDTCYLYAIGPHTVLPTPYVPFNDK